LGGIEQAIAIAVKAHAGQTDKAGQPYILHPLRVMLRVQTPEERIAAVLHDVVEDCGVTLDELRAAGFPEAALEAVEILTHAPQVSEEEYFDAIRRAAAHPIARRVKRADLEDNLDIRRIAVLTERDLARLNKYKRAIHLLGAVAV
jgi:(p)ppGpp synthase/HD superfamily hydrolase